MKVLLWHERIVELVMHPTGTFSLFTAILYCILCVGNANAPEPKEMPKLWISVCQFSQNLRGL